MALQTFSPTCSWCSRPLAISSRSRCSWCGADQTVSSTGSVPLANDDGRHSPQFQSVPVPPVAASHGPGSQSPNERRRLAIIVSAAIGLAVVLVGTVAALLIINRPADLPSSFAGGQLLTSTEQYRRDFADGEALAKNYSGDPGKYRDYLKPAGSNPQFGGESLPVQPEELLSGRYDHPGSASMRITLQRYAVSDDLWDSYVQQRLLDRYMADERITVAQDAYCQQWGTGEGFQIFCIRIVATGFWFAAVGTPLTADAALPEIQLNDLGTQLRKLR